MRDYFTAYFFVVDIKIFSFIISFMGWRERGKRQGRPERADEKRERTTTAPKDGHRRKREVQPSRALRRARGEKARRQ